MKTLNQMLSEGVLTTRQASTKANEIYAAHKAGTLSDSEALAQINKIADFLVDSQAAYRKYRDWAHFVKSNPDFYKKS